MLPPNPWFWFVRRLMRFDKPTSDLKTLSFRSIPGHTHGSGAYPKRMVNNALLKRTSFADSVSCSMGVAEASALSNKSWVSHIHCWCPCYEHIFPNVPNFHIFHQTLMFLESTNCDSSACELAAFAFKAAWVCNACTTSSIVKTEAQTDCHWRWLAEMLCIHWLDGTFLFRKTSGWNSYLRFYAKVSALKRRSPQMRCYPRYSLPDGVVLVPRRRTTVGGTVLPALAVPRVVGRRLELYLVVGGMAPWDWLGTNCDCTWLLLPPSHLVWLKPLTGFPTATVYTFWLGSFTLSTVGSQTSTYCTTCFCTQVTSPHWLSWCLFYLLDNCW